MALALPVGESKINAAIEAQRTRGENSRLAKKPPVVLAWRPYRDGAR